MDMRTEKWITDESGVKYSADGTVLIEAPKDIKEYIIKEGTKVIADGAFDDCFLLADIHMPEGLEVIETEAFHWCDKLEYVQFPSTLKRLGEGAFCGAPLQSVELPEGLESMGSIVFTNCRFETITLPSTLKELEGNPFAGCTINEFICKSPHFTIKDNLLIGGDRLIAVLCNTGKVEIPHEIKHLCSYAFSCCDNLEELTIPSWIKTIAPNALSCRNLLKINLPVGFDDPSDDVFHPFRKPEIIRELIYDADLRKEGEDLGYKLTSLHSKNTGLDNNIWLKTKYPGEEDSFRGIPRMYVHNSYDQMFAVSISNAPEFMDGLSPEAMGIENESVSKIISWIRRHQKALLRHWFGLTDSCGLLEEINQTMFEKVF